MVHTATAKSNAYIPGVCNINRQEVAKRRQAGYFGAFIFVVLLAVLLILDIQRFIRIFLFLPAFVAAIGYLQSKNKFCVGYGAAGLQNASEGSTTSSKIDDQTAIDKDRDRARQMNLQAATFGIVVTVISLLLPNF